MNCNELAVALNLKILACPAPEKEVTGAYIGDLLSWVMGRAKAGDAWITIMSNINVVAVAALTEAAVIILAEGVEADEKLLAAANAKGINMFSSPLPAYELALSLGDLLSL